MARINWLRMLGGGLIAAIIAFFTDGFFSNALWAKVVAFQLVTSISGCHRGRCTLQGRRYISGPEWSNFRLEAGTARRLKIGSNVLSARVEPAGGARL